MNKKQALATASVAVLLFSAIAGTQLVNLGRANPYLYEPEPKEVSPPHYAKPPTISIISPKNNTVFASNTVSLNFSVNFVIPTLPELFYYSLDLAEVYYKASWLSNKTYFDLEAVKNSTPPRTRIFSNDSLTRWGTYWALSGYELFPNFSVNMTDVPEGSHYLEVFAVLRGSRKTYQSGIVIHYGRYKLIGSSVVNFTIDSSSILAHQSGFLGTGLPIEYGYAIVTVIGVAIAAVAGILFFKRLRQRKQSSTVLKGE